LWWLARREAGQETYEGDNERQKWQRNIDVMKKEPDIAQMLTEMSLMEKVAELVGIKDTNSSYFTTAVKYLLIAKGIEQTKEKQMERFNKLLEKDNITEAEFDELQAFKVLIGMGLL
jgi:hypothetical protein